MTGAVRIAPPEGILASLDAAAVLDAAGRLTPGCLLLADVRGRILWCDAAVTRTLGLPQAALIGRRLDDLGHVVPLDRDRPAGVVGSRTRSWIQTIDLGPDGRVVLDVRAVPVHGPAAAEASAVMVRVVAHRTAPERRAAMRPVVEAVHADVCPVAVVDADDRILYANLRWTDLFGTGAGDPAGAPGRPSGSEATLSTVVPSPDGHPATAGQRLVIAMDDVAAASLGVAPGRRTAVLREDGARHRRLWADLVAAGSTFGDRAAPGTDRDRTRTIGGAR